jgi:biotin carboxyl carrier protein
MTELPVLIPTGFTTTITPGTTVTVGDTLATYDAVSEEAINLAEKLETNPLKVAKMLKKNPGESVEVGEALAVESGFFSSIQVQSKVAGTIIRYERNTGKLIIAPTKSDEAEAIGDTIVAPVEGTVLSVDDSQIILKTDKNVLAASRGSGKAVSGDVYILEGKNTKIHTEEFSLN